MKLYSLKINGFKRIKSADIYFGDATFLIGANNAGKSSVLKAIDCLLSGRKRLESAEYYSEIDAETGETKPAVTTVEIEAEFRNLPEEAKRWRGFKGRISEYIPVEDNDTGLSICYRKTYTFGTDVVVELKSKVRTRKPEFANCKTPQALIDAGIDTNEVSAQFQDLSINLSGKGIVEKLELIDDIWEVSDVDTWVQNPGGISGVVLSRLPRILIIPANTSETEIGSTGVLGKTLTELFEDVRTASKNYEDAQACLDRLASELDPEDSDSEFGKMLSELNTILSSVFPDSKLHAKASLSDPQTALKPTFNIEMSSNIRTQVSHQGSGMIRAAAFGMLRYRQRWLSRREDKHARSLLICFEEPEIYLHPSAANQMRNTIPKRLS